jgi:hypothetical protein
MHGDVVTLVGAASRSLRILVAHAEVTEGASVAGECRRREADLVRSMKGSKCLRLRGVLVTKSRSSVVDDGSGALYESVSRFRVLGPTDERVGECRSGIVHGVIGEVGETQSTRSRLARCGGCW